jgi:hypothetical protein
MFCIFILALFFYYYYYYYYYYSLSPLCNVFTFICLTNRVPTVYSVAAVLCSQFVLHVMLFSMLNMFYFYINTFRTTRMSVVRSVAAFCRSSMLCFPSMLLRYYCLDGFAMVPVAPVVSDITLFLYSTRIVFLL